MLEKLNYLQVNDSYANMKWNDFKAILEELGFKETLVKLEKNRGNDLVSIEIKLFVHNQHSLVIYARALNGRLSRATLYAQVYTKDRLTKKQQNVLKGSGYVKVSSEKLFFGFSVTEGIRSILTNIISEFEIVDKWTNCQNVCIGFVDNTFENKCGKATGFTKRELKSNPSIKAIVF